MNKKNIGFTIEREWPYWVLSANHQYQSYIIAWFWRKSSALFAAERLNRWYGERPEVAKQEEAYEEMMKMITIKEN